MTIYMNMFCIHTWFFAGLSFLVGPRFALTFVSKVRLKPRQVGIQLSYMFIDLKVKCFKIIY